MNKHSNVSLFDIQKLSLNQHCLNINCCLSSADIPNKSYFAHTALHNKISKNNPQPKFSNQTGLVSDKLSNNHLANNEFSQKQRVDNDESCSCSADLKCKRNMRDLSHGPSYSDLS